MRETIFITGGCGFLGSNLAASLQKRGQKVVIFDNLSREGAEINFEWLKSSGSFDFVNGSIVDMKLLRESMLLYKPNFVCHLAGQVAMTTSVRDPWGDFQTNVVGTLNLLECLRLNLPETALLYSSSNKVYGALSTVHLVERDSRYEVPNFQVGLDEFLPLDFRTPYGCSKGAADQYVLEYARTYGLRTVVFRHSTIYGGRQHSTYDQGWVGWFCQKAWEQNNQTNKEIFTISGDGKQVRDLLHVEDAARCYSQAISQIDKISGEAFNIGGGWENSLSLIELLEFLESFFEIKLRYERTKWRQEDQKYFVANTQKYRKAVGWRPEISKEAGLKMVLECISKPK